MNEEEDASKTTWATNLHSQTPETSKNLIKDNWNLSPLAFFNK